MENGATQYHTMRTAYFYGGALVRRASVYHSPLVPVFAHTLPNNLGYLLAVSKNLAHPLHPAYDDGKGGGWKWWELHFVLLNSHILAYTRYLAEMVCGLVWSTWGTSQGEDKLGSRDNILNTKVVRRANIPPMPLSWQCPTHHMDSIQSQHKFAICAKTTYYTPLLDKHRAH